MKLRVPAGIIGGVVLLALCGAARADTLVVRGHRVQSPARFVIAGDEVYAPLLDALKQLDARHEIAGDQIRITTAAGREILIHRRRPEATRDGVLRAMPGLPIEQRGRILLPARAVGSLLGCAVRWDEATSTLSLHPWVRRFQLDTLADRYRLTVASEHPIAYRTGELDNPPRVFIDLLDTNLAQIPSAFDVDDSYLRSARISQHSLAPDPRGDVTRVVIEMSEPRQCRITESEDRCRLSVDLPLPEAAGLPPPGAPVVLTGLAFARPSPRVAEVKLSVYGTASCTAASMYDPPAIVVDIPNAQSQLQSPAVEVSDRLVESASVAPAPGAPGVQRLTIALREPTGYSVSSREGEVRVLLGKFDLGALRVVVDPGHGGHDTGAVGRSGLREKDVNLDTARRVHRMLCEMGVNSVLTRSDDRPVRPWRAGNREEQRAELLNRCGIAGDMEADLFVSIHANARRDNPLGRRGTETYYRKDDSIEFASVVQRELVAALGLPDGGVIRHPKSIIVLSYATMPSILVEVAYLSHPADEALLATEEFRERAARGIVSGIRRYVEEGGLLAELARREQERASAADR